MTYPDQFLLCERIHYEYFPRADYTGNNCMCRKELGHSNLSGLDEHPDYECPD